MGTEGVVARKTRPSRMTVAGSGGLDMLDAVVDLKWKAIESGQVPRAYLTVKHSR
jgi:hypothetical protein